MIEAKKNKKYDCVVSFVINEKGDLKSCTVQGNVGSIVSGLSSIVAYLGSKHELTTDEILEIMKTSIDNAKETM